MLFFKLVLYCYHFCFFDFLIAGEDKSRKGWSGSLINTAEVPLCNDSQHLSASCQAPIVLGVP